MNMSIFKDAEAMIKVWGQEVRLTDLIAEIQGSEISLQSLLKELVRRVIIERSFKEYKIEPEEGEGERLWNQFCQAQRLTEEAAQAGFLAQNKLSREQMVDRLLYQEKLNTLRTIVVKDHAVQAAFLKRKPDLDRISISLIRVAEEEKAKELYTELVHGHRDFAEIAREHSLGELAQQGGALGMLPVSRFTADM